MNLHLLSAVEAAEAMRAGEITSEELVRACLDHISGIEERIGAWTYLDPDHALKQAREADQVLRKGKDIGPLNGLPVGVKDIFDTRDMPTEDGTVLHAGRQPDADATAVALLREAGAIILAILYRQFSFRMVWESSLETVKISAMVFAILVGATAFSMVSRLIRRVNLSTKN